MVKMKNCVGRNPDLVEKRIVCGTLSDGIAYDFTQFVTFFGAVDAAYYWDRVVRRRR